MKALVYTAPEQLAYRDEPDPVVGRDEVLIRIDAVGICGSDMHAWRGHDPRRVPPMILGHEVAGEIVAGPGVGARVTVDPIVNCGRCDDCLQGRDNLCANRRMIGMNRPGGFAQFMTTAAARIVELPAALDAREAALAEPAATVLHAIDLGTRASRRPLPECTVLVLGGGAIGMLAALVLQSHGVRRIALAETNALRRASVGRFTSAEAFDPGNDKPPADAFDLVIDAVGAKATRDSALAAVKPGGVVVHVGLLDWASEIDMRKLTLAEITLIGSYTYTMPDVRAAVRALGARALGDLGWIEERPLSQGAAAFRDLAQGRAAAAKIVLRP
ncbi:MAG TPA: alcohol dehydrogenase catalytic domain-containing protein [Casimicrobiaceae bacterium]|jgi:alcohol dehydrogenase|nr:alcohol dehydrogenase catalytic domain-containing protein [Casimicrobiaceae bacterium]